MDETALPESAYKLYVILVEQQHICDIDLSVKIDVPSFDLVRGQRPCARKILIDVQYVRRIYVVVVVYIPYEPRDKICVRRTGAGGDFGYRQPITGRRQRLGRAQLRPAQHPSRRGF